MWIASFQTSYLSVTPQVILRWKEKGPRKGQFGSWSTWDHVVPVSDLGTEQNIIKSHTRVRPVTHIHFHSKRVCWKILSFSEKDRRTTYVSATYTTLSYKISIHCDVDVAIYLECIGRFKSRYGENFHCDLKLIEQNINACSIIKSLITMQSTCKPP